LFVESKADSSEKIEVIGLAGLVDLQGYENVTAIPERGR